MRLKSLVPVAAGLLLAACTTTPTANVVRFHAGQPIGAGTVVLVPADPAMAGSLEFQAQANAIGEELRRHGFTPVPPGQPAQFTATVAVTQSDRAGPPRQSGLRIGLGGGFSSGNVGVGTSVQVPVGQQGQASELRTTTLSVQMKDSSGRAVWEGRASSEAVNTSAQASGAYVVSPLARALFKDFPGSSGRSVQVPL